MNFIYNIYGFIKNKIFSLYSQDNKTIEQLEPNIHYFFINTANLKRNQKLLIDKLTKDNEFTNKPIKIYLLKSHTIKPLFKNEFILATSNNIKKINEKINTHNIHLHTFVDAIHTFIEYNNINNYTIFY